ncbi:DUF551 domain-containing protein [Streptomyces sp. NBC_00414]|uniref:AQJ64_40280 family protein n=1 Tax=Streptomyces sp. NBC_00414 TaxID=2975739 RepID=UPI002E251437
MANPNTVVTWVDVRDGLPRNGIPVAAAITGRYPAQNSTDSEEFWLVKTMYFATLHFSEDRTEHRDCFVDSDGIVRLPHGSTHDETRDETSDETTEETVTHWAPLPTLPGGTTHLVLGKDVRPALRDAWGARPVT